MKNKKTIKLVLNRHDKRAFSTDGILSTARGRYICDTAESTMTYLKPGTYQVQIVRGEKYREKELHLLDETGKSVAVIRAGNGVYSRTIGTDILVGYKLVPGIVTHSAFCFNKLMEFLFDQERRKFSVNLTIN